MTFHPSEPHGNSDTPVHTARHPGGGIIHQTGGTWIVVPHFLTDLTAARTFARAAHSAGADAIELRCDRADRLTIENALQDPDIRRLKTILTIRPAWEGGEFSGTEEERLTLLQAGCRMNPDIVDVEWQAWKNASKFAAGLSPLIGKPTDNNKADRPKLIVSNHDFAARPADIQQRLQAMAGIAAAAVLKVAFKAHTLIDALAALRLYTQRESFGKLPLVAIAMGEAGQISRLLAMKFGAAFTFAELDGHPGSAPGQPLVSTLVNGYRFKQQQSDWRVCGLIGSPVSHSVSPMIHNAGFQKIGFAGLYIPLLVEVGKEQFAQAVDALRSLPGFNLCGTSITIPHKINALAYALKNKADIDPVARHIGAVNTLLFSTDGHIRAMNSDAAGAIEALTRGMGIEPADLRGQDIAVLGAGGAARAVTAALAALHGRVTVYNRTISKGLEMVKQLAGCSANLTARPAADFKQSHHKIIINCTAAGMTPDTTSLPFSAETRLYADQVILDTVYNPRRTRLLQMGQAAGARCIEGMEMLLGQAVAQFEGFTGQAAPRDVMRAAAEAAFR